MKDRNKRNYKTLVITMLVASLLVVTVNAQKRKPPSRIQTARVEIGKYGYEPVSISLLRGLRARITFLRLTDETCATEVVFPDYGIRRGLPLHRGRLIVR